MTEFRLPGSNMSRTESDSSIEIDLGSLWNGIRKHLPWILLTTALVTPAVYFWSSSQPPVYQSSASLMTSGATGVPSAGDTLIRATPLPEGSLQEALQGPVVLGAIIKEIKQNDSIPLAVRNQITNSLQKELQSQDLSTLSLLARLDLQKNGIYNITARAPTAEASSILADTAANALLTWDRDRALGSLKRAERSFRAQMTEIDRQLAGSTLTDLERQTLIAARASAQRNLAQTTIQAEGVSGSLESVAPAVTPLNPVAPKPLRNAIIAAFLTTMLGIAWSILRTVTDRSVRSEDDLFGFGLPTLGTIPKLNQKSIGMQGIVRAARSAGLYEAVGFLRVNLLSQLGGRPHARVMITSTAPGEGKSSLTATLADGLASSNQRVLIVDADLRRGTQQELWSKYERAERNWVQLTGLGGVRTFQAALRQPQNVQVMEVSTNVHVLPAGPGIHDSLALLNHADLDGLLSTWGQGYDIVLIDSPPLLAIADGLILGKHADGVVLIVEEGKTSIQMVKQALRRAESSSLPVLGFVVNKISASNKDYQEYNYSYVARGTEGR